jgi:2-methylisocitrate lyase-like PEP mutase family enzyme
MFIQYIGILDVDPEVTDIDRIFGSVYLPPVVKAVQRPVCANIIDGGKTENISAADLAQLGFCTVAYPWTLVAAKLKSIRETLEKIKASMTKGAPPKILSYEEVCYGVGFNNYWELEDRYQNEQEAPSRRV